MGQILHGSSATTHAVRAAIQRSKASISQLASQYHVNPKTVHKWRKRTSLDGTNENTNGLLRQYFPKGSCLSGYSQVELNKIAEHLNIRPRKTLGFVTPAYKLNEVLQ